MLPQTLHLQIAPDLSGSLVFPTARHPLLTLLPRVHTVSLSNLICFKCGEGPIRHWFLEFHARPLQKSLGVDRFLSRLAGMVDIRAYSSSFLYFPSSHFHTQLGRTDAEYLLNLGPDNSCRSCTMNQSIPSATSIPSTPFKIPNVSISPKENTCRPLVGSPLTCAIRSGQNGGRGDPPLINSARGWMAWVITTPSSSFFSILISSDSRRLQ